MVLMKLKDAIKIIEEREADARNLRNGRRPHYNPYDKAAAIERRGNKLELEMQEIRKLNENCVTYDKAVV
jgi:hypothetical protein